MTVNPKAFDESNTTTEKSSISSKIISNEVAGRPSAIPLLVLALLNTLLIFWSFVISTLNDLDADPSPQESVAGYRRNVVNMNPSKAMEAIHGYYNDGQSSSFGALLTAMAVAETMVRIFPIVEGKHGSQISWIRYPIFILCSILIVWWLSEDSLITKFYVTNIGSSAFLTTQPLSKEHQHVVQDMCLSLAARHLRIEDLEVSGAHDVLSRAHIKPTPPEFWRYTGSAVTYESFKQAMDSLLYVPPVVSHFTGDLLINTNPKGTGTGAMITTKTLRRQELLGPYTKDLRVEVDDGNTNTDDDNNNQAASTSSSSSEESCVEFINANRTLLKECTSKEDAGVQLDAIQRALELSASSSEGKVQSMFMAPSLKTGLILLFVVVLIIPRIKRSPLAQGYMMANIISSSSSSMDDGRRRMSSSHYVNRRLHNLERILQCSDAVVLLSVLSTWMFRPLLAPVIGIQFVYAAAIQAYVCYRVISIVAIIRDGLSIEEMEIVAHGREVGGRSRPRIISIPAIFVAMVVWVAYCTMSQHGIRLKMTDLSSPLPREQHPFHGTGFLNGVEEHYSFGTLLLRDTFNFTDKTSCICIHKGKALAKHFVTCPIADESYPSVPVQITERIGGATSTSGSNTDEGGREAMIQVWEGVRIATTLATKAEIAKMDRCAPFLDNRLPSHDIVLGFAEPPPEAYDWSEEIGLSNSLVRMGAFGRTVANAGLLGTFHSITLAGIRFDILQAIYGKLGRDGDRPELFPQPVVEIVQGWSIALQCIIFCLSVFVAGLVMYCISITNWASIEIPFTSSAMSMVRESDDQSQYCREPSERLQGRFKVKLLTSGQFHLGFGIKDSLHSPPEDFNKVH